MFNLYAEDDLLPISALQHLLFCERQCALIHVEQGWVENLYTAEGRIMHERVDSGQSESRGNVRICYAMPLRSLRLGLSGVADVVEFHRQEGGNAAWRPYPVEYKRGKQKKEDWDRVQLCAQAICLEEMLNIDVPEGSLFYGKTRRRQTVVFSTDLREKTAQTAERLHTLFSSRKTPPPLYTPACDNCSFLQECLPKALGKGKSVNIYLREIIKA